MAINITPKTGDLVSVRAVDGDEDLMIITNEGIIVRISLENVGVYGRNTQGVRLINVGDSQTVARATVVNKTEEEEKPAEE